MSATASSSSTASAEAGCDDPRHGHELGRAATSSREKLCASRRPPRARTPRSSSTWTLARLEVAADLLGLRCGCCTQRRRLEHDGLGLEQAAEGLGLEDKEAAMGGYGRIRKGIRKEAMGGCVRVICSFCLDQST